MPDPQAPMPLDPPPLARRLAGALPPPLRRTLAGLWLDVTGLPSRLADPRRRGDPWQALHNVGGGDFREGGEQVVRLLRERAGLHPASRVLDIGCGVGRVADPLAEALSGEGGYTGFDVSARAIAQCRRRFARLRPDFRFVHLDLANGEYNARGACREAEGRFPAGDGSVDVALANSVFSHMRMAPLAAYLREAARVLAPDGRFLFTAYVLTQARRTASGLHDFDETSQVLDLRAPERLIAHEQLALEAEIDRAGLRPRHVAWGGWAPGATYGGRQDLYVVGRA